MSERIWPIVRVLILQFILMIGVFGSLAGWLVLALLVEKLHWLEIDFHGKTLETISPDGKIIGVIIVFLVNLAIILLAWRWIERKQSKEMYWEFSRRQWRYLNWGLLAGACEVILVFVVLWALGVVHPAFGLSKVPLKVWIMALGWMFASSVLGPITEEVLNRGYWFQNIKRGWGVTVAVVITSALFGGLHLLNPNAEILGAVNIALSAAIYAFGLLWLKSLWFPIGWHAGWNFTQFFIAGLPNSGISVSSLGLEGTTLFVTRLSGPDRLSGGQFGMEASIVRTVVLIGIILGLLWLQRKNVQVNERVG